MRVTVTDSDLDTVAHHGSVTQMTGTDEEGMRVTFAGDTRPLATILEIVEDQGEIDVEVYDWAVISKRPVEAPC